MKLLRRGREFVFRLSRREHGLLVETLRLYPLVPPAHHRLSREGRAPSLVESQRLLDEALAEQRAAHRRQVQAFLSDPERFRPVDNALELRLAPAEIEWLLQVLNDVRVGAWLALGEPEQGAEPPVTGDNARYHFALAMSGWFESELLAALGVQESPDWVGP
ncbi:MAG: hypothetical protein N3I86_08610 [Verrucomicrobiae bacterium]|nr:hypothetical protein [Verrucomicrobiae bacterium]MDW8308199.1 hypothetical protein [Verrucomicrobiales bacterium]